jgi:hypothetical protein
MGRAGRGGQGEPPSELSPEAFGKVTAELRNLPKWQPPEPESPEQIRQRLVELGKTPASAYEPFSFGIGLVAENVEISDRTFIIKADEAKKHIEPPRLATIPVFPKGTRIERGKCVPQQYTSRFVLVGTAIGLIHKARSGDGVSLQGDRGGPRARNVRRPAGWP